MIFRFFTGPDFREKELVGARPGRPRTIRNLGVVKIGPNGSRIEWSSDPRLGLAEESLTAWSEMFNDFSKFQICFENRPVRFEDPCLKLNLTKSVFDLCEILE